MSEMDAPPKMEQFWDNPPGPGNQNQSVHSINHAANSSGGSNMGSSSNGHQQYERNLNFATGAVEENEYGFPKKKTVRDPLSHRIIEKRRRDRMNNCLADLARLLPPSSLRKGRGRIEKTEIVELAIKHLRHLQCHPCPSGEKCEFNYIAKSSSKELSLGTQNMNPTSMLSGGFVSLSESSPEEHFSLGFQECLSETMHFLVEEEGMYPGDPLCVRILQHLRTHSENLMRDHFGKDGKLSLSKEENSAKSIKESDTIPEFANAGGSNESTCSSYQPNGSSSGSDGNGGQVATVSQNRSIVERDRSIPNLEYEGENSCCSTQLSLDISDVFSVDSRNTSIRLANELPIPAMICSASSIHSSPVELSSSNGRSTDEGQEGQDGGSNSSNSQHRYKFKNNIKQRFNADSVQVPEGMEQSKSGRKQVTKASLKQTEESLQDDTGNSSMDEEEEITFSNSHPGDTLKEDCVLSKTLTGNKRIKSSSSTDLINSADVNATNDVESKTREEKLSREEMIKSLKSSQPDKFILENTVVPSLPVLASNVSAGIPAFALHEKGLYYVPLTIDKSILSNYLAKLEPNVSPPLHPVTISVCFLLSPQECKERMKLKPNYKELSPVLPLSTLVKVSHEVTTASIPTTLPLITVTPGTIKVPKSSCNSTSSSTDASSNFLINRFSQSRQYSPASYRYPLSAAHAAAVASIGSHASSSSTSPYLPGYYMTSEGHHHPSVAHTLYPPAHITAGYGSSNSSSYSSSSSNPSRANRKRSACNISPLSGSSSLGYHSLHNKYVPSSQDFFIYPTNTHHHGHGHGSVSSHSSHGHSHIHSSSGSSHSSGHMSNHSSSSSNYGFHHSSSSHDVSIHKDKLLVPSSLDEERNKSNSNKRVKKNRDDDIIKPKPLPIGLPIIPLPHNHM